MRKPAVIFQCSTTFLLPLLLFLGLYAIPSYGFQTARHTGAVLQQDYDDAQAAQAVGDLSGAARHYKLFLVNALNLLGISFANAYDYDDAAALFDQGLLLDPDNIEMRLDYTRESLAAGDLPKAQQLAEEAVRKAPQNAAAHLELGRILLLTRDNLQAKQQLETAVALDPNYEDGLALAKADLVLKDDKGAATILAEMIRGFGDTAQLHMDTGLNYAETGYMKQAIAQFKLAIKEDDRLRGVHYCLGAAYLVSQGEINYPQAENEFKIEIRNTPDYFLAHSQLGSIYLAQHRLQEAASELKQAAALDPQDPDVFLSLGQLYFEMNQPGEAESAFEKSIVLTPDISRNHYQVQRAHYLLARVLMQSGKVDQARTQMQLSNELLKQIDNDKKGQYDGTVHGEASAHLPFIDKIVSTVPDSQALKAATAIRKTIAPAIADSYNNLGVIAAVNSKYVQAVIYFQNAAKWSPDLDGLDLNWGHAAFSGGLFDQAIAPLERYLRLHQQDTVVRSELAVCLYQQKQYSKVKAVLRAVAADGWATPQLQSIYADSLVKTGDYKNGIDRLMALQKTNPGFPAIHRMIGEALVNRGESLRGIDELRTAVRLDSKDVQARYDLALAMTALKQYDTARTLLETTVRNKTDNADVYYLLGKLQCADGHSNEAIKNLRIAISIDPTNSLIHRQLAAAFRQESRFKDADAETNVSKQLEDKAALKQSQSGLR